MRFSRYLKFYGCTQPEGCSLLFSTWKSSVAYVPDEVVDSVRRGDPISPEYEETLRALGMVVDDTEEERRQVFGFFDELNREHKAVQVSIIVNLRCNFSCSYCYEGKLKSSLAMSLEVAGKVVEFLKESFGPDKNELILHFYGGEPLLDPVLVKRIAGGLKPFVEGRGAELKVTLVTNGSLLTRTMVEDLLPYGLANAKVTLDGPKEIHDGTRPYTSGRGSFDNIIENLRSCSDLIKVAVSGNFKRDNYLEFPKLMDFMSKTGLGPDKIKSMFFGPVQQVNDEFATAEHCGGCLSINEPWVNEATLRLRRAILENGFTTAAVTPSPCMVDVTDAFTVHIDGTITKCPALIGHKEFVVGDVVGGIGDFSEIFNTGSWKKNGECMDCEYLPLCYGGCRMALFQRSGNVVGVDCKRPHYDAVLEALLKQDIELGNLPE